MFAAGDATTVPYKQIVIAMGDGAKAALSAFDYLIRQHAGRGEGSGLGIRKQTNRAIRGSWLSHFYRVAPAVILPRA